MKAVFVAVVLVVSSPAFSGGVDQPLQSSGVAIDIGSQVDQCVLAAMSDNHMVGAAAAVVIDGGLAYESGYGVKHRDQGGEVDAHTRFRHGSTGKMMTAAAIMRLVDQGLVHLSDPVTEYVPELNFAPSGWTADQITVRHLITNSAAVPSFRSATTASLSEWAATLVDVPLLARPGAFFSYSNSNFALAGLVVERASGMAFMDYLDAEIFAVAGMADSSADPAEVIASGNYSYGHEDDGQIWAPDDYSYPIEVASGNAFSSAHDLATWAENMLAGCGTVMGAGTCVQVQERMVPRFYAEFGRPHSIDGGFYGFGLFVDDYPDVTLTGHTGGAPGWVGSLSWVRTEAFAVALLANTWPSGSIGLEEASACIYESLLGVDMPDMSEPSDPDTWTRFVGGYEAIFEDGYEFEAVVETGEGGLTITVPNPQNPSEMITRELENVAGNAFRFWVDSENWWGATFIAGEGRPAPVQWLRNPRFAGQRRLEYRHPADQIRP